MKILLTHPGTQYAPQLAAQLSRQQLLYKFVTGIGFPNNISPAGQALLRATGTQKLAQRRFINIPSSQLHRIMWPDLWTLYRMRRGHNRDQIFYDGNGLFQRLLPQRLIGQSNAIIGFDTSSWILADRTRQAGKPYIMDISIGHPLFKEQVFDQLRQRYPSWQSEIKPKRQENIEVELREMELASHFVGASGFTQKTYLANSIPAEKISINPYGTDLDFFAPKTYHAPGKEIRFLYFSKLAARKGFPWLCEVWERFHARYPHTKLVAAGYGSLPDNFRPPKGMEMPGFVHPNDRVQLFHGADVFVFPSFFEGFAQVIIEGMACGLPVITTTHTIGPELITDQREGFVIEPGDDEALFRSMEYFAQHPEAIAPMGKQAREAVLPFSWDSYGARWKEILERVLAEEACPSTSSPKKSEQVG